MKMCQHFCSCKLCLKMHAHRGRRHNCFVFVSLVLQANVRVKPSSVGWPRLSDLISNWQDGHDARWRSIRSKALTAFHLSRFVHVATLRLVTGLRNSEQVTHMFMSS